MDSTVCSSEECLEFIKAVLEDFDSLSVKDSELWQQRFQVDSLTEDPKTTVFRIMEAILARLRIYNPESLHIGIKLLANGCRNPVWRGVCGESGVLQMLLDISHSPGVDREVLLQCLRAIGNSCAGTDPNRQRLVESGYLSRLIGLLREHILLETVVPVIYNVCIDYAPAQDQATLEGLHTCLISLLEEGSLKEAAMIGYVLELLEQCLSKEILLDGGHAIQVLANVALEATTSFESYTCATQTITLILREEKWQQYVIEEDLMPQLLQLLAAGCGQDQRQFGQVSDQEQDAEQTCLAINQVLSDISASPQFALRYNLQTPLVTTLRDWIPSTKSQLQICACINIGNLARSDSACLLIVQQWHLDRYLIHELLEAYDSKVLLALLGFLKNLAVPGANKAVLGQGGLFHALARLWKLEAVPQVQHYAISLARQLLVDTLENIAVMLQPTDLSSTSSDEPTYISILLNLHSRTDSMPTKLEIARLVTAICRSFGSVSASGTNGHLDKLIAQFYDPHHDIADPLGTMILQDEWPVVKSEGWFALALMAGSRAGRNAIARCLSREPRLWIKMEEVKDSSSTSAAITPPKAGGVVGPKSRDLDNVLILVDRLLQHEDFDLSAKNQAALEAFSLGNTLGRIDAVRESPGDPDHTSPVEAQAVERSPGTNHWHLGPEQNISSK